MLQPMHNKRIVETGNRCTPRLSKLVTLVAWFRLKCRCFFLIYVCKCLQLIGITRNIFSGKVMLQQSTFEYRHYSLYHH